MKVRLLGFKPSLGGRTSSSTKQFVVYLVISTITSLTTPFRHALLSSCLSWAILWIYLASRCGIWRTALEQDKRWAARIVGLLYTFSAICERATGSEASIAATRPLLPLVAYAVLQTITLAFPKSWEAPDGSPSAALPRWLRSRISVYIALAVLGITTATNSYLTPPEMILGAIAVIFRAIAIITLERVSSASGDEKHPSIGALILCEQQDTALEESNASVQTHLEIFKILAFAATLCNAAGSFFIEPTPSINAFSNLVAKPTVAFATDHISWLTTLASPIVGAVSLFLLLRIIVESGAIVAATADVGSVFGTKLFKEPCLWSIWLLFLYIVSSASCLTMGMPAALESIDFAQQWRFTPWLGLGVLLLGLTTIGARSLSNSVLVEDFRYAPTKAPADAVPMSFVSSIFNESDKNSHPIERLTNAARISHHEMVSHQSRSLQDAVLEYRRRYGVHPPPKFDIWFEFAKARGTQLVDEFDTIHNSLLPFWAFSPKALRDRVNEGFGYDENGLMVLMIRDGQISLMEGSTEWLRGALVEMTADFIEHLPDMDIALNIHDEPRVTVPHSELSRMVHIAQSVSMPAVLAYKEPRNAFSTRPEDMTNGKQYRDYTTSRFNRFSHQPTWSHTRLSCPPDSPARDFLEQSPDDRTAYALGELGFVYNQTAFSDICNSPSLRNTYGFFDRPNMFIPTQDLVPVFSQSKLSSFQDIIYPSPWYWADKVAYNDNEDFLWEEKNRTLHWRGSTTGGYSRHGGWRRHHRQRCVQQINALDEASIFPSTNKNGDGGFERKLMTAQRSDFADAIDVKFSHVGQCDEGDCHAQKEFFHVVDHEEQKSAWGAKYLLDMDGNAFSGRFLAFLRSRSLVFKMALFREWHADWLRPWLHYIPLSLAGDEWLEAVRYFDREEQGQALAKELADESREWANRAMRKEDMEVWFFRLLLEYGRLLDDDRAVIGYPGP